MKLGIQPKLGIRYDRGMSLIRFYLYNDTVLIPTVVQAQEGFYLDEAPITGCDLADDEDLRGCLIEALMSENDTIPTPGREQRGGSIILEGLGIKKWHEFEARALMYTIHKGADGYAYYSTGRGADGLWRKDPAREQHFDIGLPVAEIAAAIIENLRADRANPPKYWPSLPSPVSDPKEGALMLLPPSADSNGDEH
jgi:hypothetical protein